MASLRLDGMGQIVKNVDVVCDQDSISDHDRCTRPNVRARADKTPVPNFNLAAMREYHQLASDHRVAADSDLVARASNVEYSGLVGESRLLTHDAGGAAQETAYEGVKIHGQPDLLAARLCSEVEECLPLD